jgi:hypothetical protein
MSAKTELTRRKFLTTAAAAAVSGAVTSATTFTIVPRHVLGRGFTPPSDTLNIAGVGVGGIGRANLIALASQNIVGLCDVDWDYAGKAFENLDADIQALKTRLDSPDPQPVPGVPPVEFDRVKAQKRLDGMIRLKTEHWPKAKHYQDYREMLERQKDIDAVVVATADHMHAPIALAAMDLNKHVYVQKPLTWSVEESRRLARRAKELKIATQMGNQGHSLRALMPGPFHFNVSAGCFSGSGRGTPCGQNPSGRLVHICASRTSPIAPARIYSTAVR